MQFIEKGKIMLKEILEFLYSKYKILSLAIMLVVLVFGICLFIQNSGQLLQVEMVHLAIVISTPMLFPRIAKK